MRSFHFVGATDKVADARGARAANDFTMAALPRRTCHKVKVFSCPMLSARRASSSHAKTDGQDTGDHILLRKPLDAPSIDITIRLARFHNDTTYMGDIMTDRRTSQARYRR